MEKIYKPMTLKSAWNLAAPRSWVASACPAIFGILFCRLQGYPLDNWMYLTLFLACILLQSSVNTLNDYMDFIKGTDTDEDNLEEKDAVLIYGGISPASALILGIIYLAAGIALGLSCALQHGIWPLAIGAFGVAVIALYSCGPHPISYLPVGEMISGSVMGGLIPLGICACADGRFHWDVLPASLPFILGIAMIMLCNNTCDIEKDILAGRKTFPVVIGREKALFTYRILILCWLALLILEPFILMGSMGILTVILLFVCARKPFMGLWKLHLQPEERIRQMQTIAAANLMGNGMLCISLLIWCICKEYFFLA